MKLDWWLTGICSSRFFSGLVVMTYAAALPILQKEWVMSAAAAGSIASAYNIGFAISLVIFSALADRTGPKPIYIWSIFAGALFSLGFALFARDYLSALILYTLVAISLGGTYTTGLMILADHYPVQRRGFAMGFFIASTSLSYALSLALSGIALPIGGYKLSFLLTCLGPVAGSILGWITLAKTRVTTVKRKAGRGFRKEVIGNRPAMLLIGGYTFHNWELLGMWAWTPAFLFGCLAGGETEGLRIAGLGAYITASFHFTGLFASFSMGALSDRLGRARVMLILTGTSALCSLLFGWSIGWSFILVIIIGLIYSFSALGDSPILSAALSEAVEYPYLGVAYGIRSLFGFGAGAISPLIFGVILDWSNPITSANIDYKIWGWAYSMLGLGGLGAFWAASRFRKMS